jgi:hypothetical protein
LSLREIILALEEMQALAERLVEGRKKPADTMSAGPELLN